MQETSCNKKWYPVIIRKKFSEIASFNDSNLRFQKEVLIAQHEELKLFIHLKQSVGFH